MNDPVKCGHALSSEFSWASPPDHVYRPHMLCPSTGYTLECIPERDVGLLGTPDEAESRLFLDFETAAAFLEFARDCVKYWEHDSHNSPYGIPCRVCAARDLLGLAPEEP